MFVSKKRKKEENIHVIFLNIFTNEKEIFACLFFYIFTSNVRQ